MERTTIAVDLAKSVFQIALSHHPGRVAEQHRLSRARFLQFFTQRQPALVLLEACSSAHHWARQLEGLGHTVALLPRRDVHRYVPRNKTDRADAKALLEAFRNEDIQPVPVKSVDQQALAALHRLRSGWLATRTARINAVRGLLREFGVVIPQGARRVLPQVEPLLADPDGGLPPPLRTALEPAAEDIRQTAERIRTLDHPLQALGRHSSDVRRLMTIPGVGWLTATALVASVGTPHRFPSGRRFASYLGLTPRERSSGARRRLGRISKQGDPSLRMLLTHGARAVLWAATSHPRPDRLRAWVLRLERSRGHNKAAVALANKLARIAWAVWKSGGTFSPRAPAAWASQAP